MRIVNWNIDQGGREGMLDQVITTLHDIKADVIVLPEFRKDNSLIKEELVKSEFQAHIPTGNYETGNQVAIFTKSSLGFQIQESILISKMEGLAVFCSNGFLTIGGVFFPKKGKNESSIHRFLKWIAIDPFNLGKIPTVLTGDFNYGIKAAEWNKGKTGYEYNRIHRWIKEGVWIDCCPAPGPNGEYVRTFCRSKTAKPSAGERWAKGSSRPDHYFVSKLVSFHNVSVLDGFILRGISDHNPIVGDFFTSVNNL